MTNAPVIIVIEDDPPIRRFLRTGLSTQGFTVFEADTGKQGIIEAEVRKPDLVILDLGLPDMEGVEVIKAIRTWSAIPIIILSARSSEQHKIDALDAGADDYLTKPFGFGELLARIRVALRHAIRPMEHIQADIFATANLKVDLHNRVVTLDDEEVHLTPIQYRLLVVLETGGQGIDAPAHSQRSLGAVLSGKRALFTHLYEPVTAEIGSRPDTAQVFIDRIRGWLSLENLSDCLRKSAFYVLSCTHDL